MISSNQVEKTLDWLEKRYAAAEYEGDPSSEIDATRIYSKLAVLELSGWIEESNDSLVLDRARKELRSGNALKRIQGMVDKIQGFRYKQEFVKIIDIAVGSLNRELIERKLDRGMLMKFRSSLDILSVKRNQLAHSSSHGTQKYFDAVSKTREHFNNISEGLQAYAKEISRISPASMTDGHNVS